MAAMKQRGIHGGVLLSRHARNVDPLAGNRVLKATLDQGTNLFGCLVAHTNRPESSIAAMREMMNMSKFLGMTVVTDDLNEPLPRVLTDDILNAFRRFSKVLFVFTPNAGCVQVGFELAKSYPTLKVVFLGMGGKDWRTAIAAAKTATNIFLETSGALDCAKIPAAVPVIGIHRILFGSGSPKVDAAAALGLIEDSGLSEETKQRILFGNAAKLFGFE